MERLISSLIIIGFVTVVLFGFAGFISDNNSFLVCVNNLTGSSCTAENSVWMTLAHIQTYLSFSVTVLTLQVLFIILLLIGLIILLNQETKQIIFTLNFFFKKIYSQFIQNKQAILHWFALLEKRDPVTVIA